MSDKRTTNDELRSTLLVVAAALINEKGEVLLAQRPAHKMLPGKWEFPGGKVEEGESPEAALTRELHEELGIMVFERDVIPLTFITHDYPEFFLVMLVYLCQEWQGEPAAHEHPEIAWAKPSDMGAFDMIEADTPIVAMLRGAIEGLN